MGFDSVISNEISVGLHDDMIYGIEVLAMRVAQGNISEYERLLTKTESEVSRYERIQAMAR